MQANLQMSDINAPQKSNMDTWVKRNYSNGTILIEVVEGRSKWKYICMTLLWHLALELVGMRRWFPKNGDSPESQDEINLWVKSAADLWCCSNISKYEQISWKCSSLEGKTLWTYSHLLGQETPRNQFPDNFRYHILKLLLNKNHQQPIKYILLLLASNSTWLSDDE